MDEILRLHMRNLTDRRSRSQREFAVSLRMTKGFGIRKRRERKTEAREFFKKIKQHCEKSKCKCKQCCLRIFCHISPTEYSEGMISDVEMYLCEDK